MAKRKLTKRTVESIMPADQDILVWDEALPGFGVRVKPSGVRSYVVQYRNRKTSASRRMTLGQHGPLMTFDQAKKQARLILADAVRGADPVAERQGPRLSDGACCQGGFRADPGLINASSLQAGFYSAVLSC